MRLYQLIVREGEHKGRYVGRDILGTRWNRELLETPEFRVPGKDLSLFVQAGAASHFSEWMALQVQREFNAAGIEVRIEPAV